PATAPGGSGAIEPAWLPGQPQGQAGGQQDPWIFPSSWQSQAGDAPGGTQYGNGDLGSQLDPGTMTTQAAGPAPAAAGPGHPSGLGTAAGGHDHGQHKTWWEQPSPPPRPPGTRVASDGRHGAGPTPTPAIVSPSYPAAAHPGICVDTPLQWAGAGGAAANGH